MLWPLFWRRHLNVLIINKLQSVLSPPTALYSQICKNEINSPPIKSVHLVGTVHYKKTLHPFDWPASLPLFLTFFSTTLSYIMLRHWQEKKKKGGGSSWKWEKKVFTNNKAKIKFLFYVLSKIVVINQLGEPIVRHPKHSSHPAKCFSCKVTSTAVTLRTRWETESMILNTHKCWRPSSLLRR